MGFQGAGLDSEYHMECSDCCSHSHRLERVQPQVETQTRRRGNVGALIIRIGFWGPLYYNDNQESGTPKIVLVII